MLEVSDLKAIKEIMTGAIDDSIAKNNEVIFARIDDSIAKNNEVIFARIDDSIAKNNEVIFARVQDMIEENNGLLFDEMERYYKLASKETAEVKKKLDEIESYYRIRKLEDSTLGVLIKRMDTMEMEIAQIKKQNAKIC